MLLGKKIVSISSNYQSNRLLLDVQRARDKDSFNVWLDALQAAVVLQTLSQEQSNTLKKIRGAPTSVIDPKKCPVSGKMFRFSLDVIPGNRYSTIDGGRNLQKYQSGEAIDEHPTTDKDDSKGTTPQVKKRTCKSKKSRPISGSVSNFLLMDSQPRSSNQDSQGRDRSKSLAIMIGKEVLARKNKSAHCTARLPTSQGIGKFLSVADRKTLASNDTLEEVIVSEDNTLDHRVAAPAHDTDKVADEPPKKPENCPDENGMVAATGEQDKGEQCSTHIHTEATPVVDKVCQEKSAEMKTESVENNRDDKAKKSGRRKSSLAMLKQFFFPSKSTRSKADNENTPHPIKDPKEEATADKEPPHKEKQVDDEPLKPIAYQVLEESGHNAKPHMATLQERAEERQSHSSIEDAQPENQLIVTVGESALSSITIEHPPAGTEVEKPLVTDDQVVVTPCRLEVDQCENSQVPNVISQQHLEEHEETDGEAENQSHETDSPSVEEPFAASHAFETGAKVLEIIEPESPHYSVLLNKVIEQQERQPLIGSQCGSDDDSISSEIEAYRAPILREVVSWLNETPEQTRRISTTNNPTVINCTSPRPPLPIKTRSRCTSPPYDAVRPTSKQIDIPPPPPCAPTPAESDEFPCLPYRGPSSKPIDIPSKPVDAQSEHMNTKPAAEKSVDVAKKVSDTLVPVQIPTAESDSTGSAWQQSPPKSIDPPTDTPKPNETNLIDLDDKQTISADQDHSAAAHGSLDTEAQVVHSESASQKLDLDKNNS